MNAFRSVRNSNGEPMAGHCRPVCPQNDRTVRSCVTASIDHTEDDQDSDNNVFEDGDDDKENELPDENANYHCNDIDPDITEKGYFEEIYKLETMNDHGEWYVIWCETDLSVAQANIGLHVPIETGWQ